MVRLFRLVTVGKIGLVPYSFLYKGNQVKISMQVIGMAKKIILEIIITAMRPGFYLQTIHKIRTRIDISGSTSTTTLKLS